MGDFLMVVPPGFVEYDIGIFLNDMDPQQMEQNIAANVLYPFTEALDTAGLLPPEHTVAGARIFSDAGAYRIWLWVSPV
jgi:hypothetical protein